MYRSYTQIFRIFEAVIIFLWFSKVAALFKIQKIQNLPVLSLFSHWQPGPAVSDTEQGTAALPTLAGQNSSVARSPATWVAPTRSTRSHAYSGVAGGSWDDRRRARRQWQWHGGAPVKWRWRTGASPTTVKASSASPHSGEHGTAANRTKQGS